MAPLGDLTSFFIEGQGSHGMGAQQRGMGQRKLRTTGVGALSTLGATGQDIFARKLCMKN